MNKKLMLWLALGAIAAGIVSAVVLTAPAPVVDKEIGNDGLAQLKGRGAMIVDVRTPAEFEGSHIPDAVNVPMEQIQQTAATWDKNGEIVVYCATGARSTQAAAYLEGQGFTKVHNLTKGIVEWTGETATGKSVAVPSGGTSAIKTSGKPLFIDFSTST